MCPGVSGYSWCACAGSHSCRGTYGIKLVTLRHIVDLSRCCGYVRQNINGHEVSIRGGGSGSGGDGGGGIRERHTDYPGMGKKAMLLSLPLNSKDANKSKHISDFSEVPFHQSSAL